jgi:ribosome maturation factor RimP
VTPLERIQEIAVRVAGSHGLEIFEVTMRREAGRQVLRVIIDKPGPAATPDESVSIGDCETMSHELGTILDVEELLPDGCTFEVSSPGLDRPLRHADDYRRFEGRLAKIVMAAPIDGQTAFAGRLRGFEDGAVLFEAQGGKHHRLPLAQVSRARLEVEF